MADVIKKATRESYGEALRDLADEYKDLVVLDADLAAATKTAIFKKAHPDRFFDCGIAEANNSIGYPHLNVKIGATHAGISVGEDGATHQCNEDIALMRTIPGMTIINPADDVEAKAAVKAALDFNGPVYMRFGRLAVPVINDSATYKFELGKGIVLRDGSDVTIVATGLMVNEALQSAEVLAAEGISARVVNIHTIKPLDKELVCKCAKETGVIVTAEEHSIIGGLGSAVAEAVTECCPVPVIKVGVNDVFGHSGPAVDLLKEFGLSAENIAVNARKAVSLK